MTKALISIDYTVDFVADDGKLTAGAPAQAISETIAQVTQLAFDQGAYVFFAIDAHDVEDPFHQASYDLASCYLTSKVLEVWRETLMEMGQFGGKEI